MQNGELVVVESYTYDYEGNRTSKTTRRSDGKTEYVKYLNDNSALTNVLAEVDSNGNVKAYYTIGDDLLSQERNGKVSVYLYDGHGSVVGLTDENGVVTDTYSYDAFGNLLRSTGTTANNYRYCGEQFDDTTGLYYLRARYMDTSTGRFISQDTYQGDINDPVSLHKYLYADANPVTYCDPSGYFVLVANSVCLTQVCDMAARVASSVIKVYRELMTVINSVRPFITAIGIFAVDFVLPIVTFVAAGTVASVTFANVTKEDIKAKVEEIVDSGDEIKTYDNSVYILTEEDDPHNVRYVGRTNDVDKRATAHSKNPLKRTNGVPWHFYTIFTGLTLEQARVYE